MKMNKIIFLGLIFIVNLIACKKSSENNSSGSSGPSAPPVINSITPLSAPYGTPVTITGTHFGDDSTKIVVAFDGVRSAIQFFSVDSIVVIVPPGAGQGPVTVSVNGDSASTLGFSYTYTVIVSTYSGSREYGYVDGPSDVAEFGNIFGIILDHQGNIIVTDEGALIRKVGLDSSFSTIAGTGVPGYLDGPDNTAQFAGCWGIAMDKAGNLYCADNTDNRIRKISTDGNVTTLAGSAGFYNTYYAYGGFENGPGNQATFTVPTGLAIDSAGNLYVADQVNNAIRKITPDGIVSTLAGQQTAGYMDGTGTAAQFNSPTQVAVDSKGNVYVADWGNYRIRKITPDGTVSTFAGDGKTGYIDGPRLTAEFQIQFDITMGPSDIMIVTDGMNQSIRMIGVDGVVSTLAGVNSPGYWDGPGSIARFNAPAKAVVAGKNTIYIAENGNKLIRKITLY
jgi:sugar lactone lactonase YvrE